MKLSRCLLSILRNKKKYLRTNILQKNKRLLSGTHHSSSSKDSSGMDPIEEKKFRQLADKWWNYNGEFQALHSMNVLRVPFICDALFPYSASNTVSRSLEGLNILDVGCGGGLLSEPLARLGANVKGIDMVIENINAATAHANNDPSLRERLVYQHCSVNDLLADEPSMYDAVVVSEVIEHITNKEDFIEPCAALLKESGSMFITTINKTILSQLLAVYTAEYVLNIVPKGTHDWNKFIEPQEMTNILRLNNCHTTMVRGMLFNPFINQWSWSSDTSMNYAMYAVKETVNKE